MSDDSAGHDIDISGSFEAINEALDKLKDPNPRSESLKLSDHKNPAVAFARDLEALIAEHKKRRQLKPYEFLGLLQFEGNSLTLAAHLEIAHATEIGKLSIDFA